MLQFVTRAQSAAQPARRWRNQCSVSCRAGQGGATRLGKCAASSTLWQVAKVARLAVCLVSRKQLELVKRSSCSGSGSSSTCIQDFGRRLQLTGFCWARVFISIAHSSFNSSCCCCVHSIRLIEVAESLRPYLRKGVKPEGQVAEIKSISWA